MILKRFLQGIANRLVKFAPHSCSHLPMDFKETYLQRSWSEAVEDVLLEDVQLAIQELQEIDDQHSTIWVGIVSDEEYILEVDKHKRLNAILDPESGEEMEYVAANWTEVEELYSLFLKEQFQDLKSKLKY